MKIFVKIAVSLFVLSVVFQGISGLTDNCFSAKDYPCLNEIGQGEGQAVLGTDISQRFIAQGNIVTNLSVYVLDCSSEVIYAELVSGEGETLASAEIRIPEDASEEYVQLPLNCSAVKCGGEYTIRIHGEKGLSSLALDRGETPQSFLACEVDGAAVEGALAIGIQQTYRYISLTAGLFTGFRLLVLAALLIGVCYSIFNFEKLRAGLSWSKKRITDILYALFFSSTLVFAFDPLAPAVLEVEAFQREFGQAFIANIDPSRRVSNFLAWFLLFGVVFVAFFALVRFSRQRKLSENALKVRRFLDELIILADLNLLFRCFTFFLDRKSTGIAFNYSTSILEAVVLLCVIYILFRLDSKVSPDLFLKAEIIAFCVGYSAAILVHKEWESGKLLFGVQAALMLFALMAVAVFSKPLSSRPGRALVNGGVLCFSLIPFGTSFYIELINILNQYSIFVVHIRKYYVIMCLLLTVLAGAAAAVIWKRKLSLEWGKTWAYLWIIFGVSCLFCQIGLQTTYNADVFEAANRSVLVSDLFNFGDIPIVQHYGGHMMSGVWEALLYALFNQDTAGAIFGPYGGYVMTALTVLFFALLCSIVDKEYAFFITLFFPFYSYWSIFGMGALICVAVVGYLKKKTYCRALLVWLSTVWCILYRLDLGASFAIAFVAALVIYVCMKKDWTAARHFSVTFGVTLLAGGACWCILCVCRGVDPIARALEFIFVSASNRNWAYTNTGDMGNGMYAWCYIIVPGLVVLAMVYILFSERARSACGDKIWFIALILGIAFFTNYSRGLVRHSLAEGDQTRLILWCAFLFLSIVFSVGIGIKKALLPIFSALILCNNFVSGPVNFTQTNVSDYAAARVGVFASDWPSERAGEGSGKNYWQRIAENKVPVERAVWSKTLAETVRPYELVINTLLDDGETFADFMNRTFMYSALNRRDPVYVSQSPLQLSGEYTQVQFIEEIKGVPIVLMPLNDERAGVALDRLQNAYRYYKVSEYIYQNYVPLLKCEPGFAVWCLPERYDEFREKSGPIVAKTEYIEDIARSEAVAYSSCEMTAGPRYESVTVTSTQRDPKIVDLQNVLDLSPYVGKSVRISVAYSTDTEGIMQLFYTTEESASYNETDSVSADISAEGTCDFIIPVTEHTRLRLDTPENSTVQIRSFVVGAMAEYIGYGYDGPEKEPAAAGETVSIYRHGLHDYSLAYLPHIWANYDEAAGDPVCCDLSADGEIYVFDRKSIGDAQAGNYLRIRAEYAGSDTGVYYKADDESVELQVKLGVYKNGKFEERYQYTMNFREGTNDYLIRVSSDYYWYSDEVNAVRLSDDRALENVFMQILEGD